MTVVDAAILILIAGLAALGFLKGFYKSFASFFSFIISLTLTVLFVSALSKALFTVPAIGNKVAGAQNSFFSWIFKRLPSSLDKVELSDVRDVYVTGGKAAVKDYFKSEQITDILNDSSGFFGKFFIKLCYPLVGNALSNPVYLSSSMTTARQLIALDLAYGLYVLIVGLILFTVIRIMAAIITMMFKNRLDKKTTLHGRLLGALLGAVKGFAYSVVILSVLSLFTSFSFMSGVNKKIDDSALAAPLLKTGGAITSVVIRSGGKTKYFRLVAKAGFENEVYQITSP